MAVQKGRISKANLVDRDWHAGKVTIENINSNYSASVNYYAQKEEAFKNYWSKYLINQRKNKIDEFLNKAAEKTMKDYLYLVSKWTSTYDSFKDSNLSSEQKETETKKIFIQFLGNDTKANDIMKQSKELTNWANGTNKERSLFNILGFTTEDLLKNNLTNMVSTNFNNLMMQIVKTGKMKGRSLITTGKKNIRVDNAIYPASLSVDFSDGSLVNNKTGEKLYFEAQVDFTLDDIIKIPLPDEELFQTFESYLNGEFAGVGGIIQKTYNLKKLAENTALSKFSESISMQQQLDSLLSTANYHRGYLTQDFVDTYIIYHLSKYIQYIVSPSAIGFVHQGGYVWMSEFLKTYRFYMNNKRGTKEGRYTNKKSYDLGKNWYKYSIPNNVIKIFNKNRQNTAFIVRIKKYGYRYGYIEGEVSSTIF